MDIMDKVNDLVEAITGNAKLNGKPVNRTEGCFQSLLHQKIGIVIQQFNGTVTV